MDQPAVAVGRLTPDGDWVGLRRGLDRYELVVGRGARILAARRASRDDVVLVALAYFAGALDPPPAESEATHADVASAVRWLAAREVNPSLRTALSLAVDAIDDGLAADEVMNRLGAALPPKWRDDPAGLLRARASATQTPR